SDGPARVVLAAPLGHQPSVGRRELAVLHAKPDQSVDQALADRPADQRHGGVETGRVTLGRDAPAMYDDEGARVPRMRKIGLGEDVVDGPIERRTVDTLGQDAKRDRLALGPLGSVVLL